jgi:adenylate cyclase
VNLAARLEPANKVYGTYTMISEYTYKRVKDLVIARELDSLQVKGKTEPVKVYELMATKEDGLSEAMNKVLEHYHRGLELYKNRQWDEAIAEFQTALSTNGGKEGPSETYVERCKEYKESPPPPTWKGEYIMTTKG